MHATAGKKQQQRFQQQHATSSSWPTITGTLGSSATLLNRNDNLINRKEDVSNRGSTSTSRDARNSRAANYCRVINDKYA